MTALTRNERVEMTQHPRAHSKARSVRCHSMQLGRPLATVGKYDKGAPIGTLSRRSMSRLREVSAGSAGLLAPVVQHRAAAKARQGGRDRRALSMRGLRETRADGGRKWQPRRGGDARAAGLVAVSSLRRPTARDGRGPRGRCFEVHDDDGEGEGGNGGERARLGDGSGGMRSCASGDLQDTAGKHSGREGWTGACLCVRESQRAGGRAETGKQTRRASAAQVARGQECVRARGAREKCAMARAKLGGGGSRFALARAAAGCASARSVDAGSGQLFLSHDAPEQNERWRFERWQPQLGGWQRARLRIGARSFHMHGGAGHPKSELSGVRAETPSTRRRPRAIPKPHPPYTH